MEDLKQISPHFDEKTFCKWAYDVLVCVEKAWSLKDFNVLRRYETNELYQIHEHQLNNMKERQIQNIMSQFELLDSQIISYLREDNMDKIEMNVQLSLIDYFISLKDSRKILGSQSQSRVVKYQIVFVKEERIPFQQLIYSDLKECPYCGAPIDIYNYDYCEYCKQELKAEDTGFLIDKIEIMSLI